MSALSGAASLSAQPCGQAGDDDVRPEVLAAAVEAKKEYSAWDEAVRAYSNENPESVEMLDAVIDQEINARAARPGEGGVLLAKDLQPIKQYFLLEVGPRSRPYLLVFITSSSSH